MGKNPHTLREYHLLVIRNPDGFSWEIRYGRHAKPAKACHKVYRSHEEAIRFGQIEIDAIKQELNASTGKPTDLS